MNDERLFARACERNREPIRDVLAEALPAEGAVLEIASGTGMHAVFFAAAFPRLAWQPTDPEPGALASIRAWRAAEGTPNLREPVALDVTAEPWPVEVAGDGYAAVFNANMIHISPFECTEALLRGAGRVLPPGGPLVLYGPFQVGGQHTSESNARFDASLRARDPRWGVRDQDVVVGLAAEQGLALASVREMPANNRTLIFRREAA